MVRASAMLRWIILQLWVCQQAACCVVAALCDILRVPSLHHTCWPLYQQQICNICREGRWALELVIFGFAWGQKQLSQSPSLYFDIGKGAVQRCILPATRVGRRRVVTRMRKSAKQGETGSPKPEQSNYWGMPPIWCPAESLEWNHGPMILTAHAEMMMGATRGASRPPPQPQVKIKGKLNNQIWTIELPTGAVWREAQWQFMRKLHIQGAYLEIKHGGVLVNPADTIPAGDIHGHVRVDLVATPLREGTRSRSRSRQPPGPRHAAHTATQTHGVQTDMRVVDMDAMYIRLKVAGGEWTLAATLEQLGATSWHFVSTSMLERSLRQMYPDILHGMGRLTFALDAVL